MSDPGSLTTQGLRPTQALRREILYEQEGRCLRCGIEEWRTKRALQLHRIVPGRLGGLYEQGNLMLLCARCHYHEEAR